VIFSLLVFAGVLILSFYDVSIDRFDHHPTFTVKFGIPQTRWVLAVLCLLSISFALFLWVVYAHKMVHNAAVIYTIMALSILMLIRYSDQLRKQERFRFLAEMVFWIPGLILFIQ
jgi:4-hydroxybenzoate polyprenyltransferase